MTDTMDHSNYKDHASAAAALEALHKKVGTNANPPGRHDPFPQHLFYMLQQIEKEGLSHIVGWAPHGRSFVVHKREEFVKSVLPVYFKQTKHSSFQRQLALYGFKRISEGPDRGSYYHPLFLQISGVFCRNIARTRVKNEGPRKKSSPDDEPDFYSMPKLSEAVKREETKRQIPELLAQIKEAKQSPTQASPVTETLQSSYLLRIIAQHMNTFSKQGGNSANQSPSVPPPSQPPASNYHARVSLLLSQERMRQQYENQIRLTSLRAGNLTKTLPRSSTLCATLGDILNTSTGVSFGSSTLAPQSQDTFELLRDHLELTKQQQQQQQQRRLSCTSRSSTLSALATHRPSLPALSQFAVQEQQDYVTGLLRSSLRY